MKVERKINDKTIVHAEGETAHECFEQIAAAHETFEDTKCACCQQDNLKFVVRVDDEGNKYYELHCQNSKCRAKLTFGTRKKTKQLYPRRNETYREGKDKGMVKRDANGKAIPLGKWGWTIYKPGEQPTHETEE
jgi:hypothetical protein